MEDEGYSPVFYVMLIIGIVGVLGFLLVGGAAVGGNRRCKMNEKDNLLRHIKNLLEMVADDSATIELQAAQLEQYAKMLDDERAAVAQLRAQLDAVPVNSIRRYYAFTHYDAPAANDAGYTTQQFDSDDMWIGMWLESLDGDA